MKIKEKFLFRKTNLLFVFSLFLISESLFAYVPNSTDAVDQTDYTYLKAKYASVLSLDPAINTNPADLALLTAKDGMMNGYVDMDNQLTPNAYKDIVIVGSSIMQFWSNGITAPADMVTDLAPLPVMNRGIGGSIMIQQIHYFSKLVPPHHPKVVVMYNLNDIDAKTADQTFEMFRYFEYLVHEYDPTIVFYIVSGMPAPTYSAKLESFVKPLDVLLKNYATFRPNTKYIDIYNSFLNNGTPNATLFNADGLHLSAAGYQILTPLYKIPLTQSMDLISGKPTIVVE